MFENKAKFAANSGLLARTSTQLSDISGVKSECMIRSELPYDNAIKPALLIGCVVVQAVPENQVRAQLTDNIEVGNIGIPEYPRGVFNMTGLNR